MIWYGFPLFWLMSGFILWNVITLLKLFSGNANGGNFFFKLEIRHNLITCLIIFVILLWVIYARDVLEIELKLESEFVLQMTLSQTSVSYFQLYYFPFIYIFLLVTFLSIVSCLTYNYNESGAFINYCAVITLACILIFLTNSILWFFFAYEMLLLPSFFILYKFAKTRRCIEAAYLMFFWTQFGALALINGFSLLILTMNTTSFSSCSEILLSPFERNYILCLLVIGFGVKLPIWPFYGWLPKAHVEASTNFSIFLSGVLVKIAFFGLFRCLIEIKLESEMLIVVPILILGLIDAVFKMFYQIDLKKLVAYATVVEMHWLTICILSGYTPLLLAGFCMLISHAIISTNSFIIVDAINRRFKTRLITEIGGLNFLCPKLFLISICNLLIFLGFPGSIFFIAEVLFFTFLFDEMPTAAIMLLFILFLLGPVFFFRSWSNVLFGSHKNFYKKTPSDLKFNEILICVNLEILLMWLGFTWQYFII